MLSANFSSISAINGRVRMILDTHIIYIKRYAYRQHTYIVGKYIIYLYEL